MPVSCVTAFEILLTNHKVKRKSKVTVSGVVAQRTEMSKVFLYQRKLTGSK